MVKERSQLEADHVQQCADISTQLQRKDDQITVGRERLIAVRKATTLGRTGNQALAEQRKQVN